jgi:hypothetical protein
VIYETDVGSSDDQLIERLDFHGRARFYKSWMMAQHSRPIIVGARGTGHQSVDAGVVAAAVEAGVIRVTTEWDRGHRFPSYRGVGIVEVDGVQWHLRGESAHDDENHDFTAGSVTGQVVRPVDAERLRCLSARFLTEGDIQGAMTFAHFAARPLEPLDHETSSEAINDISAKMVRLRVWDLDVEGCEIDPDYPYLVSVSATCDEEVSAEPEIPLVIEAGRLIFGAVPRAGMGQLSGGRINIPSPDGPQPPD